MFSRDTSRIAIEAAQQVWMKMHSWSQCPTLSANMFGGGAMGDGGGWAGGADGDGWSAESAPSTLSSDSSTCRSGVSRRLSSVSSFESGALKGAGTLAVNSRRAAWT